MSNLKRFIIMTMTSFTLLAFIIYSGFWFYLAGQIKKQTEDFIAEAAKDDIVIVTRAMGVKNFPFTPEAYFSGRVSAEGMIADIPELNVRSTFIPARPLVIELPLGLSIIEPKEFSLWSFNRLLIETLVPENLPAQGTHEDIRAWKDAGGQITLNNIELDKESLRLTANGTFTVDESLQPVGTMQIKAREHMAFLQWLQKEKFVETKQAILASAILTGLSKTDLDSGENYLESVLTIQNQTLFLGPLRLAYLPAIEWGWRSPIVLPQ